MSKKPILIQTPSPQVGWPLGYRYIRFLGAISGGIVNPILPFTTLTIIPVVSSRPVRVGGTIFTCCNLLGQQANSNNQNAKHVHHLGTAVADALY